MRITTAIKPSRAATRIERLAFAAAQLAGLNDLRCEATDLPGRPDVVCDSKRIALFAHGCFWHDHGCALSRLPRTNTAFWRAKFARNKIRDDDASDALLERGWRVIWLWECACRKSNATDLAQTLRDTLDGEWDHFEILPTPDASDR